MRVKIDGHIYDTETSMELAMTVRSRYRLYRTRTGRHFVCDGKRIRLAPTQKVWERYLGHYESFPWDDSKLGR